MSINPEISQVEMRKKLKELGLKVRVKSYSSFSEARVFDGDKQINGGNVLTQEHLDRYAAFYDFKNSHSIVDDGWRTIL
ncbi:hypothetical protein [Croceicoccus gelatinilyticus]|uniref:hypothetical protein n=1 Tax=Croceicoccus gelatinilyticus TaxID=2835536 RepID=UPI001BCCA58C|nr:hypothetical protein [Croceicoccus gelatinilyticus]MBS7671393.1 hypothetical protein [Croceicoccus gelatinilyticus]